MEVQLPKEGNGICNEVAMKLKVNRSIGWNLEYATMKITQIITDGADCYPWTRTFVIWPRRTITGQRIGWQRAYKRRVWVVWGTGFHMEPETQYATLFEILADETNNRLA